MPLTLKIDPWNPAYESALQIDEDRTPPEGVKTAVETEAWDQPIQPGPAPRPDTVVFIDGAQRLETRVIGEDDGTLVYGAFVSIAVGAVIIRNQKAALEPQLPHRIIALGEGKSCEPYEVPCGSATLRFQAEPAPDRGPDAWRKAVDRVRRDAESLLGIDMVRAGHPLVIVDGRLTFQPTSRSLAVGVSKSIRTVYLTPPYAGLLADLQPGTRTPIFEIPYEHPVYSWYVRLADPRPIEHSLAGIVQVETMAGVGVEAAVHLADLTAIHLPTFASEQRWDARAPQNLYPVAALEHELRRRMGDAEFIRRSIEAHFYRTGVAA